MDESSRLRIRSVLAAWLPVLVALAIVLAGVGAWATYTAHVDPPTTTEERTTTVWTADSEFAHSATVTRENPLYAVGSELTDRSVYLRSAAPVLDGELTVRQQGLADNVSVSLNATLVLASADGETVYWTDRRPLNETTVSDAEGPVTLAFALNTTRVVQRISEIESAVGSTPGTTNASVVVDARVSGVTEDGERSQLSFSRRVSLGVEGDTYTVSAPGNGQEPVERTTTVTTTREYGPVRGVGGPAMLLLGAVATGVLLIARRRGEVGLTEAERERLDYLDDRAEFDEWIVSVRLPPLADDRRVATASSLADLVNLAIDTDTAVIEEPDRGAFHVVTSEYRYTYDPPDPADGASHPALSDDDSAPDGTQIESTPDEEPKGNGDVDGFDAGSDTSAVPTEGTDGWTEEGGGWTDDSEGQPDTDQHDDGS